MNTVFIAMDIKDFVCRLELEFPLPVEKDATVTDIKNGISLEYSFLHLGPFSLGLGGSAIVKTFSSEKLYGKKASEVSYFPYVGASLWIGGFECFARIAYSRFVYSKIISYKDSFSPIDDDYVLGPIGFLYYFAAGGRT